MSISIKKADNNVITQIENDYKNGKSLRQIEKDYGISRQSVSKYLEEKGIKTTKGNHYRIYYHDFKYFKDIDTEEKAYWLGFMFADGYILNNNKFYGEDCFGITLHSKDVVMLEKFKYCIQSTNPIADVSYNNRSLRRILMSSQETVNDLISHGCVKQKSLILKPPIGVPDELIHHFIRGFFDGDGSIFYDKSEFEKHVNWKTPSYNICITSTKEMIEWIIEQVGIGNISKENRREHTWYYRQSGNNKVKYFCDYIYKDATIYMDRKFQHYQNLLKYTEK